MNQEGMTQFKTEGQPAFPVANTENDNFASSSEDQTTTDQTQTLDGDQQGAQDTQDDSEAGDRGFADHPRWKEREADWTKRFNEQEQRHADELKKAIEAVDARIAEALKSANGSSQQSQDTTPEEVPSWFGGDEEQWASFQKWNSSLIAQAEERGAQKAQQAIEAKSKAEQEAIEQATTYMNDTINAIEADKALNPDGAKIDRNKLLKFVLDNELVDTQGRWNYKVGYQLMRAQEAGKSSKGTEERKRLAGATTTEKGAEVKPNQFATPDTFQNPQERPW